MQVKHSGTTPFFLTFFSLVFVCILQSSPLLGCDNTATQSAGNIQYIGDGLYTIDIENCVGDGGSEDGITISISDVNIVGFYPASIINGSYIATGSFNSGDISYTYSGTDFFVAPNQNTCFQYTLTLDGFPANSSITLSGVNTPGGCAILDGNTQTTPVIPTPTCGGLFMDTGGTSSGYGTNEDYSVTICGGNAPVTVDFTEFELALDGDIMTVFDNTTTAGSFTEHTGGNSPGTVTSSNPSNCLTFLFESNSFGEEALGWLANVICANPCPNDLAVTANPSALACLNSTDGTIDLSVSGGALPYSFEWSDGQTIDNIEDMSVGDYTVTVTDGNSCTATTLAALVVANPIIINLAGTPVNCSMPDGTLSATINSGGSPPFTYLWSNGSTSDAQTGLNAGIYDLTVTDSDNCESTSSITLNYDTDLAIVATPIQAVSCFGATDGSASVVASGGMGSYTFNWDNGETGTNASSLNAGEHIVSVTDDEGCTITTMFTIDGPVEITAQTTITDVSCFGFNDGDASATPIGGTPPYSYLWDNGDINNFTSNLNAGIHGLTITDSNGCSSFIGIEISGPAAPLSTSLSNTEPVCNTYSDGSISTEVNGGTPGYSFEWNDGQTTAMAENLAAGIYTLTVTDTNGCVDIVSTTLTEPPPIDYNYSVSSPACYGGDDASVSISDVSGGSGIGLFSYSMDGINYGSSPTFIRLESGEYTFYIQDDEGCVAEQGFSISSPPELIIDAGEDVELEYGDSLILSPSINVSGNYSYEWTSLSPAGSMSCTDCPNPTIKPLYDIVYTLNITNDNGCEASDELRVYVSEFQRVFIPSAFTPNDDNSNDIFMIHGGKGAETISSFNVYNRWGEVVFSVQDAPLNSPEFGWTGQFKNDKAAPGVYAYFATIVFEDGEELPYKGHVTLIR